MDDATIDRKCRVCGKRLLGRSYKKEVESWPAKERAKVAITPDCYCGDKCRSEYYDRVVKTAFRKGA